MRALALLRSPIICAQRGPLPANILRSTVCQASRRAFAAGDSESDRRYEETGEYDTQEKYKRVGNPIAWANPTGGGTVEDNSSKHWTWVFPAGGTFILALCLLSRWRSQRKEREEQVIEAPRISMPDTQRFSYKAPSSEPLTEDDLKGPEIEHGDSLSPSYGGSFSPPPPSR
ncbi:unnamed protein product [Durusdinium trenchii]|uniref:Uncharacterized protein n=1 Tax=Durusdinium trenchii TaxID=1381693 RepID=A0ABP0JKJ8_9DINO